MLSIEGTIILKNKEFRRRIEISQKTGLISKICKATGKADILLADEYIFPGFIDLHVHAREDQSHTQDYKENFLTASNASINGGVVMFLEMPNNPIPPIDDKTYMQKFLLTKKSLVPIILYAGIGKNTKMLTKKVPYKVFLGKSIGDMYFNGEEELDATLKNYKGCFISFHCEDPKIMDIHKEEKMHADRRPIEAELRAIDIVIKLVEKYHLHGKICHVSTIKGIEKIIKAKKRGVSLTTEITPHHLYFDQTMLSENSKNILQVNPPIRQTEKNRLALIKALKAGQIDYLATDHAPHTKDEKIKGISGMPHLDTYGSFVTWLMKEHNFTSSDILRICSSNPGNFVNNFSKNKYGELKKGFVGSLTIVDMKNPVKIVESNLKTKCGWSPFDKVTFPGKATITMIKGKVYSSLI